MQIKDHESLLYTDIILKHNKSILPSRSEANISRTLGNFTFATPLVAANMPSLLNEHTCKQFDAAGWFYVYPRMYDPKKVADFIQQAQNSFNVVSISIGITDEWLQLLEATKLYKYKLDFITVDVACAYTDSILPVVKYIKDNFPETYLIVGNTANAKSIPWFESLGVDCVKLNVGVSKSCRTKEFTGFSCTPLGNLIECAEESTNVALMSDGGLTVDDDGTVWIGDIAKAIRFGADFVMSGAVFAGCVDSPSYVNGYYGNSTAEAKGHSKHVEGATVNIKKNKTIADMMLLVEDSLRSSVSYAGGHTLYALEKVDFIDLRR